MTTPYDGYTNLLNNKSNKIVVAHFSASGLNITSGSTASYVLSGTIPDGYTTLMFGPITTGSFVGAGYISGYRGNDINVWLHAFSGSSSGSIGADVLCIKQ